MQGLHTEGTEVGDTQAGTDADDNSGGLRMGARADVSVIP